MNHANLRYKSVGLLDSALEPSGNPSGDPSGDSTQQIAQNVLKIIPRNVLMTKLFT